MLGMSARPAFAAAAPTMLGESTCAAPAPRLRAAPAAPSTRPGVLPRPLAEAPLLLAILWCWGLVLPSPAGAAASPASRRLRRAPASCSRPSGPEAGVTGMMLQLL